MSSITVRNVPDEVHRALRVLAAMHGPSAETEIRLILSNAVQSGAWISGSCVTKRRDALPGRDHHKTEFYAGHLAVTFARHTVPVVTNKTARCSFARHRGLFYGEFTLVAASRFADDTCSRIGSWMLRQRAKHWNT